MPDKHDHSHQLEWLRRQAEEVAKEQPDKAPQNLSTDTLELINELELHQAELASQNKELKRSQQELSALHQEYERLYEFAPCGYLSLNAQGILTRANLAAASLLGMEKAPLFRLAFSQFIVPGWESVFFTAKQKATTSGKTQHIELPLKSGSQKPLWVQANIQADRDTAGNCGQWHMILTDITERKQTEKALIEAKQEAEEARKETEDSSRHKSEFLASMSHEIRTPMNSILGMLRLVLSGDMPDKQRERLQVAKDSAESLLWLLNDLLDLSRIEAGRFTLHTKEFRLRHFLHNVAQEMEFMAADKGIAQHLSVDQDLPTNLVGDPYRLRRILINLLSNAIKFTDQGWVSLEASLLDLDPCAGGDKFGIATVLFRVKDTGRGIEAKRLQTIFESYDQGDNDSLSANEGTGLGLAICSKLTWQMGGSIWVESQPGQGSTFYVQLPLQTDGEVAAEAKSCSQVEQFDDLSPLRILLVEDQKMNQIFTVDLLTSYGHRVVVAEDGRQALDKLSRSSFDLVLMDIKMPVMDGKEAALRIRTADPLIINPDIPIIGLSAHVVTDNEVDRFRNAGFDHYVVKPVSFENLFAAIHEVLSTKRKP